VKEKIDGRSSMRVIHKVAVFVLAVMVAVLLVVAVYLYMSRPIGYGITKIQFGATRLHDSMIWVVVENNKNTSLTLVAVSVNGTEIGNELFVFPNLYPRLPMTIAPRSRIVLLIQEFDWKWSDPSGTTYTCEITLVADDGAVFTKSKETPPAPR
jgi:hypothetical protein